MAFGVLVALALSPVAGELFGYTEFFLEPTPYPEMEKILAEAPFWFRVEKLYYRCEKVGLRMQDFSPLNDLTVAAQRCGSVKNTYIAALEASGVMSAKSFARRYQPPFGVDDKGESFSCPFIYLNCSNYLY